MKKKIKGIGLGNIIALLLVVVSVVFITIGCVPQSHEVNDVFWANQYYLHGSDEHGISVEAAWNAGLTGKGVTVAIIDTGTNMSHEDAPENWAPGQHYFYEVGDGYVSYHADEEVSAPDDGHGSFVTSIIAAPKNNGRGVAGVAPGVTIMPVRCVDGAWDDRGAYVLNLAMAIDYAVDHGADIINMSWVDSGAAEQLRWSIQRAYDAGCIVIASCGNAGDSRVEYPAGWPEVISVGATDMDGKLAFFSNRNFNVDVCAPGINILGISGESDDKYTFGDGTSYSAAIVSGVAALMKQAYPDMTQDDFLMLLTAACDKIPVADGESGAGVGRGLVNVRRMLDTAAKLVKLGNWPGWSSNNPAMSRSIKTEETVYPFRVQQGKVALNRYCTRLTHRMTGKEIVSLFPTEEQAQRQIDRIAKDGQGTITELDVSAWEWMDGLAVSDMAQAIKIYEMGQDAWEATPYSKGVQTQCYRARPRGGRNMVVRGKQSQRVFRGSDGNVYVVDFQVEAGDILKLGDLPASVVENSGDALVVNINGELVRIRMEDVANYVTNQVSQQAPVIDAVTGNWKVYNPSTNTFDDTGVNAQGPTGSPGRDGNPGQTGPVGPAPNIIVGNVTTLAPGLQATVTRRAGSPDSAPIFDFGIPRGESGPAGSGGNAGSSAITVAPRIYNGSSADYDVRCGEDDAATISEAISALPDSGGTVRLLAGSYTLNSPVEVPDNCNILGSGHSGINNHSTYFNTQGFLFRIVGSNVRIGNMSVLVNNNIPTGIEIVGESNSIFATDLVNIKVEDIDVHHNTGSIPFVISVRGDGYRCVKDVEIDNCSITGSIDNGNAVGYFIKVLDRANFVTIRNCNAWLGRTGILIQAGKHHKITDNSLGGQIVVSENCYGAIVAHNYFDSVDYAIGFGGTNGIIIHNTMEGDFDALENRLTGIQIGGKNNIVIGNVADGSLLDHDGDENTILIGNIFHE